MADQTPATTEPGNALLVLLDKSKQQIAQALPKHLKPETMIRMALTTFRRSTQLHKCDPVTIVGCVIQASELGLQLSGPLGQAYMIPRWNKHTGKTEANFQIGYRGLMRLAFNSGMVSHFSAHEVREKDLFKFEYGTEQKLRHIPARGDRGDVTWFYATIKTKDGSSDFEVMSIEDMHKHRDRFRSQAKGGPWDDHFIEMGKKTMILKLGKRCPLSTEFMEAATAEDVIDADFSVSTEPSAPPTSGGSLKKPKEQPVPEDIPADMGDDQLPAADEPMSDDEKAAIAASEASEQPAEPFDPDKSDKAALIDAIKPHMDRLKWKEQRAINFAGIDKKTFADCSEPALRTVYRAISKQETP